MDPSDDTIFGSDCEDCYFFDVYVEGLEADAENDAGDTEANIESIDDTQVVFPVNWPIFAYADPNFTYSQVSGLVQGEHSYMEANADYDDIENTKKIEKQQLFDPAVLAGGAFSAGSYDDLSVWGVALPA